MDTGDGIVSCETTIVAHVTNADWLSLVRQEAVRLQRTLSTSGMPSGMNLELPCTASWDLNSWSIRFDQADWVVRRYEDRFQRSVLIFLTSKKLYCGPLLKQTILWFQRMRRDAPMQMAPRPGCHV